MGLKLKGAELVITLAATAVLGFMAGWYAKKLKEAIKDSVAKKSDD